MAKNPGAEGKKIVTKPKLVAKDPRGTIQRLVQGEVNSINRIVSKKGSVRANHYHKNDSHVCYLASGKMRYWWRPALSEKAKLRRITVKAGDLLYTPPMVAHAMEFLEDSEFYDFNKSARAGQASYEDDIVRVTLVEPKPL